MAARIILKTSSRKSQNPMVEIWARPLNRVHLTGRSGRPIVVTGGRKMGIVKRAFGYGAVGAAKVAARRAWESKRYGKSALSAAEAGFWAESARNLLEGEETFWVPRRMPDRPSRRR